MFRNDRNDDKWYEMKETLSVKQAQKLVLLSQHLPPKKQSGSAILATLSAIEHLGYIQIDTISTIERAHHHTLWNRNPRYEKSHLNQLVTDKKVFEYWSHAASYLPMCDYRFSLFRKHAIAQGVQNHWYERDEKLMKSILKRIESEGPLMAKDFENTVGKLGEWRSKPAKRALENLFMQGDLMIHNRINFHKVYDLTERVLPEYIDVTVPTIDEYARFIINRYLRSNGLGKLSEISYLLRDIKTTVAKNLKEMVFNKKVLEVSVDNDKYYALPETFELLNKQLKQGVVKILSPFDNFVIQRKRVKSLFNFDYQIECYVPAAKRKYGYFSLPILWNGQLVARMDCKAERKEALLRVNHLALEPTIKKIDSFFETLYKELESFLKFNNCNRLKFHKTTQGGLLIKHGLK